MQLKKQHKHFGGVSRFYQHDSITTKTIMNFSVYLPQETVKNCIVWLSGLTCNEENFITKAGAQQYLKNTNTMLVCPDTSPRGLDLPKEHDSYDFGSGAGFYLNATTEGYKDHYCMYEYISKELIELIRQEFRVQQFSIMGHSMGGHGALVLGLKEQTLFKTVSAFSPIVNPSQCPWGKNAFLGYLGNNEELWKQYDATELLKAHHKRNDSILIDQGLADEFLEKELLTQNFQKMADIVGQKCDIKYRDGYDHSYYYISTFIKEHIDYHLEKFLA